MGDESDEMQARRRARERKEFEEWSSERAKAQRALDWAWELKLARDAELAYRRARPDEIPERGEYSPIARYERETGRR